jgi:hypothetical protein
MKKLKFILCTERQRKRYKKYWTSSIMQGRERACIGGVASVWVAESGGEGIQSRRRRAMKNEKTSWVVGAGSW